MTNTDFAEKRPFPWGIALASVVALGLIGSCSWFFVGLFQNAAEVKLLDDSFIATSFDDGLPKADADVYSPHGGITVDAISSVNTMIENLGTLRNLGTATCQANSSASTDSLSGHFVVCSRTSVFSVTSAIVSTTWRREDETWKVLGFNLNLIDIGAYTEAVAERAVADAAEAENE